MYNKGYMSLNNLDTVRRSIANSKASSGNWGNRYSINLRGKGIGA